VLRAPIFEGANTGNALIVFLFRKKGKTRDMVVCGVTFFAAMPGKNLSEKNCLETGRESFEVRGRETIGREPWRVA